MAAKGNSDKMKNDKPKKKKEPGRIRRWFKDFFSELKKVTWPSFSKVLKQTGIVLLVTVCFLLVMMAFDVLLSLMYDALLSGLSASKSPVEEAVRALSTVLRSGGGLL